MLEEFYPEAEAADFHRIGVQVHAKETVFYEDLLFLEEGFLDAGAFSEAGVVFKGVAVGVGDDELVVGDFDVAGFQAGEDAELVLDGDEFVEGGDKEVARADGGVANAQGVEDAVGPGGVVEVVEFVAQFGEGAATPVFGGVEFLEDGAAEGFAADIHGDVAGGEEGAVLVAVDFFKDEAEDGGVDEGFAGFFHFVARLGAEVVGVEEVEEVGEGGGGAGAFAALGVAEDGFGEEGEGFLVAEGVDEDAVVFDLGLLEEGGVEVGDVRERSAELGGAVRGGNGEDFEEEGVEGAVVLDFRGSEEGFGVFVPDADLAFEEFEEEDAVEPGDDEFEGDGEGAFVVGGAVVLGVGEAEDFVVGGEL